MSNTTLSRRPGLFLVLFAALVTTPLLATTVVPAGFSEIVADASLIVRGHVTDVRAFVAPDADVESVVTVAVDTVLKGRADPFVSVRVPGGEIGRYRTVMVGAPQFQIGNNAVLFLRRGSDNVLRPVGLWMGVYRIRPEPTSGRPMIDPPLVAGRTATDGRVVRGDVRRRPMTVPEFESLVRLVMASRSRQIEGGSR